MIRSNCRHLLRRVALSVIGPAAALLLLISLSSPALASPVSACQPSNQRHCQPTLQNLPKNVPNPTPTPQHVDYCQDGKPLQQNQGGGKFTCLVDVHSAIGDGSPFLTTSITQK